ncbi:MAG TPA: SgcJ/EcaC family oxidoreductase [Tepidisphaeraceae bacterium]
MSDDERAIRDLVSTWMAASKAGDLETVLGLMADDVVFMVAGREPFGKEEFAASSKGMAGVRIDGKSEIVEIQVMGDWAWMRNRLRVVVTPPGGNEIVRSGYTLTILRRQADGKWVIARDANMLRVEK